MNGGVLRVTDQSEFDRGYIKDLLDQKRLCVVENKTERFRFFIDLDYKSTEALASHKILGIAEKCAQLLKAPCYIARTPPRTIGDVIKTGVHFHFPDLVVNKQEALKLRNRICLEVPDYADSIDTSVYVGSGLRLVWSHKFQDGRYYEPYVPWKMVTADGYIKDLQRSPNLEMLRKFTIRTQEKDSEETQELDVPSEGIEGFIRKVIPGQGQARVLKIFVTRDNETLGIKTDSRYCENIGRQHKGNHVWFWIKNGTVRQMCLDEECKHFKGREYVIPPSIKTELLSNADSLRKSIQGTGSIRAR